jgi:hypothetical protein
VVDLVLGGVGTEHHDRRVGGCRVGSQAAQFSTRSSTKRITGGVPGRGGTATPPQSLAIHGLTTILVRTPGAAKPMVPYELRAASAADTIR